MSSLHLLFSLSLMHKNLYTYILEQKTPQNLKIYIMPDYYRFIDMNKYLDPYRVPNFKSSSRVDLIANSCGIFMAINHEQRKVALWLFLNQISVDTNGTKILSLDGEKGEDILIWYIGDHNRSLVYLTY